MSNIPNITDICGTVVESLAETIRNRETLIAELREDNARAEHMCLMREHLLGQRDKQIAELQKQIEGWRDEVEALEKDQKELYRLQQEIRPLKTENIRLTAQRDAAQAELANLKKDNQQLVVCFGRGDAYWTAISDRDDARRQYCELVHSLEGTKVEKIAHFNGWDDLYRTDNTPNLFEQQSDTDPRTGVQYGDLN
jgi:predicted RNase H-like nuclease (RuvC/YqgF family)